MKNGICIFLSLILVGCGELSNQEKPLEQPFDGVWVLEDELPAPNATDVKVTTSDPTQNPKDPCEGINPSGDTINIGLMRVSKDGNVLSAKNISLSQQRYEWVGKLSSNGLFVPTLGTESEYVSAYAQLATAVVSVKPLIYFMIDDFENHLYMDIQVVTNSATGVSISDIVQRRKYRRITQEEESQVIQSALECLK